MSISEAVADGVELGETIAAAKENKDVLSHISQLFYRRAAPRWARAHDRWQMEWARGRETDAASNR